MKLNHRKSSTTYLFFASASLFFAFYLHRIQFEFTHIESYRKLFFNLDSLNANFFNPLDVPRIFGHPPLLTYIIKFLFALFGKSYFVLKTYLVINFSLGLFLWTLILKDIIKSLSLSLTLMFLFALSPGLLMQSFNFFYEIPALTFFLASYYFYRKQKLSFALIFSLFSAFTLESYLAWPLALFLCSFKTKIQQRAFLFPILLFFIYLLSFYLKGEPIVLNPSRDGYIEKGFNFIEVFLASNGTRIPMLKNDFLIYYLSFLLLWVLTRIKGIRMWNIIKEHKELSLCVLIISTFFLFVTAPTIARNFLYLPFFLSLLYASILNKETKRETHPYTLGVLIVIVIFSLSWNLLKYHEGSKQYYLQYELVTKLFHEVTNKLPKNKELVFIQNESQRILYDPMAGFATKGFRSTTDSDYNVFVFTPNFYKTHNLNTMEIRQIRYDLPNVIDFNVLRYEVELSYR